MGQESNRVRLDQKNEIKSPKYRQQGKYRAVLKEPPITLIEACSDPELFKPWFNDPSTWKSWFAFIKALFGYRMRKDELALFQECTGRTTPPKSRPREVWLVCGRRAGKSLIVSLIATFLACFYDWRPFLSPGERGTIMVIATDRRQARVIFRYIEAFLTNVPLLTAMVERYTQEIFELSNQVAIEIHTANFRATRGYTIVAALLDEIAFWKSDQTANPDKEVLDALRPGMTTIPHAMLFAASSPWAKRGVLWETYDKYYGKDDDDVLVWQAPTVRMNPTVPEKVIQSAYARDPVAADTEYGAVFRPDVNSPFLAEPVYACVDAGVYERPPVAEYSYVAFVDPSGGSNDAFTLAIAHSEETEDGEQRRVLDLIREYSPPFSPGAVVAEMADILRSYGVHSVTGDRYGGVWPREVFAAHGIEYVVSDKTRSDIYRELLPLVNSRQVRLLDHRKLLRQLLDIERRTSRSGREVLDHPPGGHDDVANAAAGALTIMEAEEPLDIW